MTKQSKEELPPIVFQTVHQRIAADKREARLWQERKRRRGEKLPRRR